MTTLFYGVAILFTLVMGCGIIAPQLISASSDLAVIVGFLTFPITFAFIWKIIVLWAKTAEGQLVISKFKESA